MVGTPSTRRTRIARSRHRGAALLVWAAVSGAALACSAGPTNPTTTTTTTTTTAITTGTPTTARVPRATEVPPVTGTVAPPPSPGPARPLGEGEGRTVRYAVLGQPSSSSIGAIASDPTGRLWFETGATQQRCLTDIDPATGRLTATPRPVQGVATGTDGSIWYPTGTGVVRQAPGGTDTTVDVGATIGSEHVVRPIAVDRANRAWVTQTEADAIARVDPDGQVRAFRDGIPAGAKPGTIAAAADGGVWFAEPDAHLIGHADADGAITQIDVGGAPEIVVGAPDGGAWFYDREARGFGRIGAAREVRRVADANPSAPVVDMAVAPDGSVWYVGDPGITGRFGDGLPLQELPTVDAGGSPVGAQLHHPRAVTAAPDGTIWFTDALSPGEGSVIALYAAVVGAVPAAWPADLPLARPIGSTITTCGT